MTAPACARAALHQHLVPALNELIRGGRQQSHPVFVILDFLGHPDNHIESIPLSFPPVTALTWWADDDANSSVRFTMASTLTPDAAFSSASMIFWNSP